MAQAVAYPDIALEKITGLDSSEDTQPFIDFIERKIVFTLSLRPDDADEQELFDHRQKQLFGSVLRGPCSRLVWRSKRSNCVERPKYKIHKPLYRR